MGLLTSRNKAKSGDRGFISRQGAAMKNALDVIMDCKIVPVVVIDDPRKAVPLAHALVSGGLSCIEVTLRTENAIDAISRIARDVPEILTGAGTVVSQALAEKAAAAGSRFIVTPGFNPSVVDWCMNNDIPVIPGVNNPTGVEAGMEKGLSLLKFFPAEVSGGTAMLDALAGPYPSVSFMPTGGISRENLISYLKRKNVFAIGGSWMVPKDLVAREDWNAITALVQEAFSIVSSLQEKK